MKTENGTTRTDTQFSIFLANKPKVLAQICQQLAEERINILALSMMDASEHGVLRLVATDPERTRASLAALNLPTAETTVLMATLPNHPGAMADVVERLSDNHISVNYAYCTSGAPGGKTVGVFRVSDLKKATKVLAERKPRRKTAATSVRNAARARRS